MSQAAPAVEPLLVARGVSKFFGATAALRGFNFTLYPGQIHALVGENGAGKSTFIKILAGIHRADEGTVTLPKVEAGGAAVAFIHQDLGLVPGLSVAENLLLGLHYPRRAGLIDWRAVRETARAALKRVGAEIDPRASIESLPMADRALVAIARALHLNARILVLDEPTATLPGGDVHKLFSVLRGLRSAGIGMIYVSHRLSEILSLADFVTVVRDGRLSYSGEATGLTQAGLISFMVGNAVERSAPSKTPRPLARTPVLRISRLSSQPLNDIELALDAGEVVGCVGLRGAGQETISQVMMGMAPFTGQIQVLGRDYRPHGVGDALARGVSLVSGNREEAIVRSMTVRENLFVNPRFSPLPDWLRNTAKERRLTEAAVEAYDIRPRDTSRLVGQLSGGNAQKVVFARGLGSGPRLVILDDPTAGVDMPTRFALYDMMRAQAEKGVAFLVSSSDHEEVAAICDRIHVFRRGQVVATLTDRPFDAEQIADIAAEEFA